jgi:hypothetical protein
MDRLLLDVPDVGLDNGDAGPVRQDVIRRASS